MKVFVTGPNGFIASHLMNTLKTNPNLEVIPLGRELLSGKYLEFFKKHEPDIVVHLATLFLKTHDLTQIEPLIHSNLTLTAQLLECSVLSKVKHFISFGTYYQYPEPVSLYAATKKAVDAIFDFYAVQKGLPISELYLYDSYGPNDPREKILNLLMKAAHSGVVLPLSPGLQKMKLIHVSDVVSAIQALFGRVGTPAANGVQRFAVEPLEALTLKEIARSVENALGKKINAEWGKHPYVRGVQMDPKLPYPSLPNWKAEKTLHQGLVEMTKLC